MRLTKRLTSILALMLTLSMVLTGCQVPEGVEIPSGVSIPSDITEEELAELLPSLEQELASEEASGEETIEDVLVEPVPEQDMHEPEAVTPEAVITEEEITTVSKVTLPSGRDWVHKILNVEEYRKAYKDLQAVYGDDWDGYVDHYLTHGLYEGRDEGKLFDPWAYAEAYPDVKEAFGDDVNAIIAHYVNHGINEGKTAGTAAGYVDMADKTSREYMMSHDVIVRGPSTRMEALISHADMALKYGRNLEGARYPKLFVDGLNVDTLEPAIWSRGSSNEFVVTNFLGQANLLKMLDGLTMMTGEEKYRDAAYEQIRERFMDPTLHDKHGLVYGTVHNLIDLMSEKKSLAYHETKDGQIPLELFWEADPEGCKRFIEGYWIAHIYDWSALTMNRHGYWDKDVDGATIWDTPYTNPDPYVASNEVPFLCTGNDMMEMMYFLTEKTGDPKYQVWGERMLDKYIGIMNLETGLIGPQYGNNIDGGGYIGDRFLHSFLGADFVMDNGFDFKTATMEDFRIAGQNAFVRRDTTKSSMGYGPQDYVEMYRWSGDEKVYDFIKLNMKGFVDYVYNQEKHIYNTPMMNDGTDVNEGDGGKKLVATKGGYYIAEGKSFAEQEGVWVGVMLGAIESYNILKPEDADLKQRLWEAIRTFCRFEGLGDLGTSLGENVDVNLNTTASSAEMALTAVMLYKYSGNEQYYNLALRIGDNIVKSGYNPEIGMFISSSKAPYLKFDTTHMYAVFCVEAMARGFVDEINFDLSHNGIDWIVEGQGQTPETTHLYGRSKVKVKKAGFEAETETVVVDMDPKVNFNDLEGVEEAHAIRQMASLGVVTGEPDGAYQPAAHVTRGEFAGMVARLFGYEHDANVTLPYADVTTGNANYEDICAVYAAGVIDENFASTNFEPEKIITREEAASMVVLALEAVDPSQDNYYIVDALYRITDKDQIAGWALPYADVCTNYRLMVDIDDETFDPKTDVTKAMAADILAEVARYVELKVQKLNLEFTPYDADNQKITWESADCSVVEVDAMGRLYPVGTGTAKIVAEIDGIYSYIDVIVSEKSDWMIKDITINGALLDGFNASILEYEINLDKGVTQVPTITANSYSGAPVQVTLPAALPGAATLKVEGCEVEYTIQIDNDYIEYIVNDNFNHKLNTLLDNLGDEKFSWFINGTSREGYLNEWKVVPKNWVRPDYEGYGCIRFPYRHEKYLKANAYLYLAKETKIPAGEEADDKIAIVEMELAVKNMKEKDNGFEVVLTRLPASDLYHNIASFLITPDNTIIRRINSSSLNVGTRRKMPDGEFVHLVVAMDMKNKTFNYYINGELLEKDVPFFHENAPDFGCIRYTTMREEHESNAEMFMDNLKVYKLTRAAYTEMMSQEVVPDATPEPEWISNPIDENFDKYPDGTTHSSMVTDYYGSVVNSYMWDYQKVVPKTEIDPTAAATDKVFMVQTNPECPMDGNLRFTLDTSVAHVLGDGAVDENVVMEFDFAVSGTSSNYKGFVLAMAQHYPTGTRSINKFVINDKEVYRFIDSTNTTDGTLRTAVTKGEFNHMKIVVNKKTKTTSYYINGVMIEKACAPVLANVPDFGTVLIGPMQDNTRDLDAKLYLDNLKVYTAPVSEEPTPRPTNVPVPTATPAPTATPHPYPIDQTFDEWPENGLFRNRFDDHYSTSGSGYSKVVKRNLVDASATATDMMVEFTPQSDKDTAYRFNLDIAKSFVLGDKAFGSRYVAVEMELAIAGADERTQGYVIQLARHLSGGYHSVATLHITDTQIAARSDSSNNDSRTIRPYTKGQFGKVMVIVDKQTKKFNFYWNNELVIADKAPLFATTPELGTICFSVLKGDEGIDSKLYVDNVKMYELDAIPGMPTADPNAPTATPAPTAAPTSAPEATVAPAATAAPTAEPTAAPTYTPVIVDMDFDAYEAGTQIGSISGDFWIGKWGISFNHNKGQVVAKKDALDATAASTDMVYEVRPATSADTYKYNSTAYININEEKWYPLGETVTDEKYLVVEMDMALNGGGTQTHPTGYAIRIGGDGNYGLTNFKLYADHLGRHLDSSTVTSLRADSKNAYTKGTVGHLKWVLDRETKKYSYFWNGQLVESNITAQFSGAHQTPAVKYLFIQALTVTLEEGVESFDEAFYLDNIEVYVTNESPLATPAPTVAPEATAAPTTAPVATEAPTEAPATPAPTVAPTEAPVAEPYAINTSFDEFEIGKLAHKLSGDGWASDWNLSFHHDRGVVVAKNAVFAGAAANDHCVELGVCTSVDEKFYNLPYFIRINDDKQLPLGSPVDSQKYVVAEFDMAIVGADAKTEGYEIRFGGIDNFSIAQFRLYDDGLYRNIDSSLRQKKADYTKGQFVHMKLVIDRATKKYTYYLNGQLVESNVAALFGGENHTPALKNLRFTSLKETLGEGVESLDTRFYLDNVKIYSTDAEPTS